MGKNKKLYRHSSSFYRKCKTETENELLKIPGSSSNGDHVSPSMSSTYEIKTASKINIDTIEDNITENIPNSHDLESGDFKNNESGSDDSSDEENDVVKSFSLKEDLKKWTMQHKPTNSSLNDLLSLLNKYGCKLPKDGRALLKTDNVVLQSMGQGQLWYQGVKNNLINNLTAIDLSSITNIELLINVDGMSLFNSSASEVWPIAFALHDMPKVKPMFAAIFYGHGKPPLEPFLSQFIEETNSAIQNSIIINDKKINVKIRCFVCDTPARAFLKGTPSFNATKSSCIKCTVEGVWDKNGRHMSYPMFDCPRRTDVSFRSKLDEDHHVHETPLVQLSIDMVEDFVVDDALHLFDLGIMRKCLMYWCNGSFNFKSKLRGSDIDLLNKMLEECEKYRPQEIQRNIRGVKFLKYWKGTEFRVMLLYLGIVVLKDVLISEVYEHFLLLSCAVTILSCNTYLIFIDIAKSLLEEYLEGCINIYGPDSISSNFHNLCDVVDDVKKFGALPDISAYQFENSLGQLKSLVRSEKQPLKQIAHWITRQSYVADQSEKGQDIVLKGKTRDGFYRKVYFKDFMLSTSDKNSWFLTKNNDIVKLNKISQQGHNILMVGKPLEYKQDCFTSPFKSSKLNIFSAEQSILSEEHDFLSLKQYNVTEIKSKLFTLTYRNHFVFVPLLHTLDSMNKS